MDNLGTKQLIGILLIGDGVLALMRPEYEAAAWSRGPWLWRQAMRRVQKNPTTTRLVASAQIITGICWLVSQAENKQQPNLP